MPAARDVPLALTHRFHACSGMFDQRGSVTQLVVLISLSLLVLSGCEPAEQSTPTYEVRDSAGITIVTNHAPVGSEAWQLSPEAEVSIGAIEGDAAYLFSDPSATGWLADGRIFDSYFVNQAGAQPTGRGATGNPTASSRLTRASRNR